MTVRAIYKNGSFQPMEPVNLPEDTPVDFDYREIKAELRSGQQEILSLLKTSFESGESDVAERHNEHQP